MMQEEQLIQVTDGQLKQDPVISNAVIRPHDQATITDLTLIRCERLAAAWAPLMVMERVPTLVTVINGNCHRLTPHAQKHPHAQTLA